MGACLAMGRAAAGGAAPEQASPLSPPPFSICARIEASQRRPCCSWIQSTSLFFEASLRSAAGLLAALHVV